MKLFVSDASSWACCAAVLTWAVGGRIALELADELRRRTTPGFAATADLVQPARLGEELLGGRQVEAGERRAADRRDGAEADESRDAERSAGPSAWTPTVLSDLEVLLLRGRLVDHDVASLSATHPSTSVSGLKREAPSRC